MKPYYFSKSKTYEVLYNEIIKEFKIISNSKKALVKFEDIQSLSHLFSKRSNTIIKAINYLIDNPFIQNDYYKYTDVYYQTKQKLNEKYFSFDLEKLSTYYHKIDQSNINSFSINKYVNYLFFMCLKLDSTFEKSDEELFSIIKKDNREYNPLTNIPSVLRTLIPFNIVEYDIKRAFPTFIDIELDMNTRQTAYDILDKKTYSINLNACVENSISKEKAREILSKIYGEKVNEVITDERYNTKGQIFRDLVKYEEKFIHHFVLENDIEKFVRLHDAVIILQSEKPKKLTFGKVEFIEKEVVLKERIGKKQTFYKIDSKNNIITSPSMYADFLIQEKFIKVSNDDDKIRILKNENNVVDFFNHNTEMVTFLEENINELDKTVIRNKIAKENHSIINQSYLLLKSFPLRYYKDTNTTFGLPFKNGFISIDKNFDFTSKKYSEVNGFFAKHKIQNRVFSYTDEIGNYEQFISRVSTGSKEFDRNNQNFKAFCSMIGYLCHNHKSLSNAVAIVLTDEGADDEHRNGGRGKTIVILALKEVLKTLQKSGVEFNARYTFNYSDLDESYALYSIDDVPASFNYNSIYTNITGEISCQKKGKNAIGIDFQDTPKFIISTNWSFRYDAQNESTNRRFCEYQFKPYFNINNTPKMEFGETFFEDWKNDEWNKFYSFIFRCAHLYLNQGLIEITYDKSVDNFNASFNNDLDYSVMSEILNRLIIDERRTSFNVSEFLFAYKFNPHSYDNVFHKNNAKNKINAFLPQSKFKNFKYNQRDKRWVLDEVKIPEKITQPPTLFTK
jgi:hypothetical protein